MKDTGIGEVYPAGRFDKNLNIVDGNHSLQEFMGEFVYFPLYKMVYEDDLDQLKKAVECCDSSGEDVDEYIRMQTESGKYEHYIIHIRKCENNEHLFVELFNTLKDREQIMQLSRHLSLTRDYLTLAGDILSAYRPEDDSFRLYWINTEQTIDICNTTLEKWKKQVLEKNWVKKEELDIFSSVCEAMKRAEDMQTHSFIGSILTSGEHFEKYQIKFWPRYYDDKKIVLGIWSVLTESKEKEYSNYVGDSYIDSLTQLLNKKAVTEYAQQSVDGRNKQLAIVILDIDNFKNINDTYGHLFGDKVIRQTADILKKVIRNNGVAGRIGGDEFMLVIENFEDEVRLRNYLRSIKQNVATLFQDKLTDNPLSCSIGVARNDVIEGDFKDLFMTADKALYIAKQKGKNRYVIYKPELHGQFNVSDNPHDDMLEIRKSYYSHDDIRKVNELLSKAVIHGKECFPELLAQAAHTLIADRLSIFWNDASGSVALTSAPDHALRANADATLLNNQNFLKRFENDLHMMTNFNSLEYNFPKAYQIFKESGVLSTMQYLLRDENGEIAGLVSADKCNMIQTFPKIAVQIFENMCQIINGILLRK